MNLNKKISLWLAEYLDSSKLSSFVVGISGGIDSALVSTLCAQTNKPVITASLPLHQAKDQLTRANKHIQWLKQNYSNVESIEIDLSNTFDSFKNLFDTKDDLGLANSKSRLRMTTLYYLASIKTGLVVGTGNKVEDFGVGFFTKYGDGGVDISPIADLTKSEVRLMAKELGIIEEILTAPPTDGLWEDNRTDEQQIGASYEELEYVMSYSGNLNSLNKREKQVYDIYNKYHKKNKHKMVPIPVFKK